MKHENDQGKKYNYKVYEEEHLSTEKDFYLYLSWTQIRTNYGERTGDTDETEPLRATKRTVGLREHPKLTRILNKREDMVLADTG